MSQATISNLSLREILELRPLVLEIYEAFSTRSIPLAMKAVHDVAKFLNYDAEESVVEEIVAAIRAGEWANASKGMEHLLHLVNFRLAAPPTVVSESPTAQNSPADRIGYAFDQISDIEAGGKQFLLPPVDPTAILAAISAFSEVIKLLMAMRRPNPLPAV